jgi:hypothetical protein
MKKPAAAVAYALYLVVIAEIALQAFYWVNAGQPLWRRTAVPIFAADTLTGFWNKPNLDFWHRTNEFASHVLTNASGLRVPSMATQYDKGRDPARYRIVVLGPSFAFGWGVNDDDSFVHALETSLRNSTVATGKRVEVIDAGVPFMSAGQSLDWYEQRGRAYAPDLVLLLTYGSLDIAGEYGSERLAVDRDGYLVPRDAAPPGGLRRIAKNSAIVFYGWSAYRKWQGRSIGDGTAAKSIAGAGRTLSTHGAFTAESAAVAKSLITYRRGRELSAANGGQFLVVAIPVAYAVHKEDIPRWQDVGVEDVDAQLEYDRRFCADLTRRDIPCVDVAPDLIAAARQGVRQYYWLDGHWTPAGNATAAHAVARRLLETAPRPEW